MAIDTDIATPGVESVLLTRTDDNKEKNYANSIARRKKLNSIEFSRPTLTRNELKSVLESLIQDNLGAGSIVKNLEKEYARAFEFEKAIAVSSHTSAWHLALLACDVQPGQEVIFASNAPVAILDAVSLVGATPVLVDIARESLHPSVGDLVARVTENTAAIAINYFYGSYHNYEPVQTLIEERTDLSASVKKKIKIIQDISGIAGAEVSGAYVGGYADIAVMGLHEDHMVTIGKGAVLLTDSNALASVAKDLRMHGGSRPYRLRFDYALTDYQAAMALEQLSLLHSLLERRRKIAMAYFDSVKGSRFSTMFHGTGSDAYTGFPVISDQNVEHMQRYFQSLGIETRRTIPLGPLHGALGLSSSDYPNTEKLYQRGVLLPLYPNLTRANIERICSAIRSFY